MASSIESITETGEKTLSVPGKGIAGAHAITLTFWPARPMMYWCQKAFFTQMQKCFSASWKIDLGIRKVGPPQTVYCRIGIYDYRATKNSRKADFSCVLYFTSERVLQRHLLNQTVIKKCEKFSGHLTAITSYGTSFTNNGKVNM